MVQDQGTAIWLFAYFGYWIQIWVVIAAKAITGSLLVAGVRRKQLKTPAKGKGVVHDNASTASDESTIKAGDVPKGKEVQPGDFLVHPNNVQHKGKAEYENEAEASGSSGSSSPHQYQQPRHVQMANMHQ